MTRYSGASRSVSTHQPPARVAGLVVDEVLTSGNPAGDQDRLGTQVVGGHQAHLGGVPAPGDEAGERTAASDVDLELEAAVLLVPHDGVLGDRPPSTCRRIRSGR